MWISWYEWKAAELNKLFLNLGIVKTPGRIQARTVKHGESVIESNFPSHNGAREVIRSKGSVVDGLLIDRDRIRVGRSDVAGWL